MLYICCMVSVVLHKVKIVTLKWVLYVIDTTINRSTVKRGVVFLLHRLHPVVSVCTGTKTHQNMQHLSKTSMWLQILAMFTPTTKTLVPHSLQMVCEKDTL